MIAAYEAARYRFGGFVLDCGTRQLLAEQALVALTPKEFQTLVVLVEAKGMAVRREAMMAAIWPDTIVGDTSLARNISVLRRHLGAEAIESVPRFGYRFTLPVVKVEEDAAPVPAGVTVPLTGTALREAPTLRRPTVFALAAAIVAAAVLAVFAARGRLDRRTGAARTAPGAAIQPVRLAVLPLRNEAAHPAASDYLRDGIVDDLTSRLGRIDYSRLRVLAQSTSRLYADSAKPTNAIAAETGAHYLLEGSVEFQDDEARLLVNFVDAPTQTILWTESFRGPLNELDAEDEAIAQKVAAFPALALATGPRLQGGGPGSFSNSSSLAKDELLRGRSELDKSNRDAYRQAVEHFERAVALAPDDAEAWAGLADAYIYRTDTLPMEFSYRRSREAADVALRLDPGIASVHRDLAYLALNERNDPGMAERQYREALRLDPQDSRAHMWFANLLTAERRYPEALQQAQAAYELDPRSARVMANRGFLLIEAGDVAQGLDELQSAIKLDAGYEPAWGYLGTGYLRAGRYAEAAAAFDRAAGFEAFSASYLADAAYARAKSGDEAPALRLRAALSERARHRQWVPAQSMALVALAVGQRNEAADWVHKGVADRTITLFELNNSPLYNEIATWSDFPQLVSNAGELNASHSE